MDFRRDIPFVYNILSLASPKSCPFCIQNTFIPSQNSSQLWIWDRHSYFKREKLEGKRDDGSQSSPNLGKMDLKAFMIMWKIRCKGRILRILRIPYPSLSRPAPFFPYQPHPGKRLMKWAQGLLIREFQYPRNIEKWVWKGDTSSTVACHLASWLLAHGEKWGQRRNRMGPFKAKDTEQDSTWSSLRIIQYKRRWRDLRKEKPLNGASRPMGPFQLHRDPNLKD